MHIFCHDDDHLMNGRSQCCDSDREVNGTPKTKKSQCPLKTSSFNRAGTVPDFVAAHNARLALQFQDSWQ